MKTYSVKEASELLGVKERAIQYRCKRDNIRKKDNKYLITEEIINSWRSKEEKTNANAKKNIARNDSQLDLEVESLKENIKDLQKELEQYQIKDNERLEVFTNEEYKIFEQRLIEWQTQRKEIEHQEQIFNAEKKSINELYEHYKDQFYYQRKQNEKVLEMHQKLIDLIGEQTKITIQRNVIEAIDKEVIKKDTWKPK